MLWSGGQQRTLLYGHACDRSVCNLPRLNAPRLARCPIVRATSSDVPQYTEGTGQRPLWAGGGWLSDLANLAINTPPVYALLTRAARAVLKQGAQRQGIDWDGTVERLQADPAVRPHA